MKVFRRLSILIAFILAIILSSCSSGGGDSTAAVAPLNTIPIADAGRDQNALNDALVVLDGSQSKDDDGDTLTYGWTMTSKPAFSTAVLTNPNSTTPSFTTDAPGTYIASLLVNDGVDNSIEDTVSINALSSVSNIRDTDIEKCFDNTAEITCPNFGEGFYGQDAHYTTNPLHFIDNGDSTVSDSITGLMWQKSDDGSTYNWYQAAGIFDATYNSTSINVCKSLTLAGFTNWRLPGLRELFSILDMVGNSSYTMLADTNYFQSTGEKYWSTTQNNTYKDSAYVVGTYGYNSAPIGAAANSVRCVRGTSWGQNSYVDNGNGTVTDNMSGLVWQQSDDGVARNWSEALSYCENLTLANSSEWRLPDIRELESLTTITGSDETLYNPALNTTYFPLPQLFDFWSSSTASYEQYTVPNAAWIASSYTAYISDHTDKSAYVLVRCVK